MKSNLYQCRICPHKYKEKELAKKCGAWCANHKSCNLEIIKYAVNFRKWHRSLSATEK